MSLLKFLSENGKESELLNYEEDLKIILFRTICCGISAFFCFLLILVYFILCLQVKFNVCIKNEGDDKSLLDNDMTSENDSDKSKNNNKKGKIGLGSNFMFLLTISNFFGSIFEFIFYFYYKNKDIDFNMEAGNISNQRYKKINDDNYCHLFGFAHNFFDLFTVCWISMLTLLFYRSTNLSNEMLYHDNKYLIIGFAFSIISCLIFCGIPFFTESYGFARYYCSFRYYEIDKNNYKNLGEETLNKIWRWCFVSVTGLNNIFNAICLFKTSKFYSKKLKIIKTQNKKEYKIMLIYVWVFRIFPIVLIISRFFKGISRILINNDFEAEIITVFEYINGFLFASNGIFDSIACIFFFRGVFWCCSDTPDERISNAKDCSDINNLHEITEMNTE